MPTIEELRAAVAAKRAGQSVPPPNQAAKTPQSVDELRAAVAAKRAGVDPATSEILNESSDIPFLDRLAVKNFGGSTQDQIEYLKQKNPDLEVELLGDEIVARKKGEAAFKKLDPSGFSLRDLPADLGDVGYDLLAGGAQTAASGAAGIAGAAAGGVGAIPAAMAAGAASGGALEGTRQAIGNLLGTAKGADLKNVGVSTAIGGVAPVLFGTGASKSAINNAVKNPSTIAKLLERSKEGFLEAGEKALPEQVTVAKEFLKESQRGLLGKAKDWAVSVVSGAAPKQTLENAVKDVPKTVTDKLIQYGLKINPNVKYTNQEVGEALTRQGGEEVMGNAVIQEVSGAVNKHMEKLSKRYTDGLQKAGVKINLAPEKAGLEAVIEKAATAPTKELQDAATPARELLSRLLTPVEPKQYLNTATGQLETLRTGRQAGFEVSPQEALDTVTRLSSLIDDSKSFGQLDKMDAAAKQFRNELVQVRNSLQDRLYGAIGETGDETLRKDYKRLMDFRRVIEPKFKDIQTAAKTMQNINNKTMGYTRSILKELDKTSKTNILDFAKLGDVAKYFGDPSLDAVSFGSTTSTNKYLKAADIAGSAGYVLGNMTGTAGMGNAGAQAGKASASILSSPAAVAAYLQGKTAVRRGAEKAKLDKLIEAISVQRSKLPQPVQNMSTPQAAVPAIWNMMNNGGQ